MVYAVTLIHFVQLYDTSYLEQTSNTHTHTAYSDQSTIVSTSVLQQLRHSFKDITCLWNWHILMQNFARITEHNQFCPCSNIFTQPLMHVCLRGCNQTLVTNINLSAFDETSHPVCAVVVPFYANNGNTNYNHCAFPTSNETHCTIKIFIRNSRNIWKCGSPSYEPTTQTCNVNTIQLPSHTTNRLDIQKRVCIAV